MAEVLYLHIKNSLDGGIKYGLRCPAIALSGAIQHNSGCLGSKYIVAINNDNEANIFSIAHFGIVADYKEVLPALTAKFKELLSA